MDICSHNDTYLSISIYLSFYLHRLCGFPPFYGDNLPEVFEQIMKAEYDFPDPYWTEISPEAKDFISKLLNLDAKKRYSAGKENQYKQITMIVFVYVFSS